MHRTGGQGMDPEKARAQAEDAERQEEQKRIILRRILQPDASDRLSRLALVKPEKAKQVEHMLIQMAQSGRLPSGKVDDAVLVSLLESAAQHQQSSSTKVTIQRRKQFSDDEDEDDY